MDLGTLAITVTLVVQTISVLSAAWKGAKYFIHAQNTLEKVQGIVEGLQDEFSDLLEKVNRLSDIENRVERLENILLTHGKGDDNAD